MKITAAIAREKSGPFLFEAVELEEPREKESVISRWQAI